MSRSPLWSREKILALPVGGVLSFEAHGNRGRTVRKTASLAGSDNDRHYRVHRTLNGFEIKRIR